MHLSEVAAQVLTPTVATIVWEVAPTAVVCFGHSCSQTSQTSCFRTPSSAEVHHFDLLVVQQEFGRFKDYEIVDLVKNIIRDKLSLNVLSHREQTVFYALHAQHPFFCRVFCEGHIVHLAESRHSEVNKIKELDATIDDPGFVRECQRSFTLSDGFLSMASDALGNHLYEGAVFLLHQSMEQLCIATIKTHLKYRPSTHNLSKLIDLVGCYLPEVKSIFPCNTAEEREMFDYLQKAYSDVRYKPDYRIPPHVVFSLLERVNEFQRVVNVNRTSAHLKMST